MDMTPIIGKMPGEDDNNINQDGNLKFFIIMVVIAIIAIISLVCFFPYEKIDSKNEEKQNQISKDTQKLTKEESTKENIQQSLPDVNKNDTEISSDNTDQTPVNEVEGHNKQAGIGLFFSFAKNINDKISNSSDNNENDSKKIQKNSSKYSYEKAKKEFNKGNYESALSLFESLNDYEMVEKCKSKIKERDYSKAVEEYKNKNYEEAQRLFESLNDYNDSKKMFAKCKFKIETSFEFCKCQKGIFIMGSPDSDKERYPNEFERTISISNDFFIGKYEVTQKQYKKIMGKNPSENKNNGNSDNFPVESVTWDEANRFCEKLTKNYEEILEKDYIFDLPTEAEWEFACKAGTNESRYGELDKIAWTKDNSGEKTHEVGLKEPNAWGIHDMLGNVLEWCKDNYAKKEDIPQKGIIYVDYYSKNKSNFYRFKGGSYYQELRKLRAAYRDHDPWISHHKNLGFRVAIVKKRDNKK